MSTKITQKAKLAADDQAKFEAHNQEYAEWHKQTLMAALRDWPTEHLHAALNKAYAVMWKADMDIARSLQPRIDALELVLQHRKNKGVDK